MLNDDSVPVWMLADSLLALLVAGVLSSVAILPLAIRNPDASNPDARAVKVEASLRATQEALTIAQAQVLKSQAVEKQLELEKQSLQQIAASRETELSTLKQSSVTTEQTASKLQLQLAGLQRTSASEKSVRQELLGLKGSMDKTVFVIDISASMANEFSSDFTRANWQPGENAWNNVQRKIHDYLEMLPVGQFRIVCFNHQLQEFPGNSTWSADRKAAREFLTSMNPEGYTNTEQALQKAATYRPSSIILFTDGQPTKVTTTKSSSGTDEQTTVFDVEQQLRILAMPGSKIINCPVNVIALNDYATSLALSKDTSPSARTLLAFLQELAGRSGGAFLGY